MVRVKEYVDIRAEPEAVFSLVSDVARKARLNPSSAVLGVAQKPPGPVAVGTTFHYRLVIEGQIVDYHARCVVCEPGRMMETVSDSNPPFKIRVTVEAIPGGARLTQEESFTFYPLRVSLPRAKGWLGKILRRLFGDSEAILQGADALAEEEAQMESKLRPRLVRWLAAIKIHLERERVGTEDR